MNDDKKPAAMSTAERKRAEREAKRAAGLEKLELWAHKDDHPAIKQAAARITAKRAKSLKDKQK